MLSRNLKIQAIARDGLLRLKEKLSQGNKINILRHVAKKLELEVKLRSCNDKCKQYEQTFCNRYVETGSIRKYNETSI